MKRHKWKCFRAEIRNAEPLYTEDSEKKRKKNLREVAKIWRSYAGMLERDELMGVEMEQGLSPGALESVNLNTSWEGMGFKSVILTPEAEKFVVIKFRMLAQRPKGKP
jgi:hypothetical protein